LRPPIQDGELRLIGRASNFLIPGFCGLPLGQVGKGAFQFRTAEDDIIRVAHAASRSLTGQIESVLAEGRCARTRASVMIALSRAALTVTYAGDADHRAIGVANGREPSESQLYERGISLHTTGSHAGVAQQ
jgi:hypothetical protein